MLKHNKGMYIELETGKNVPYKVISLAPAVWALYL
jgi:hypothetical protein